MTTPNASDFGGYHELINYFYDTDENGEVKMRDSIFASALNGESTLCEQGYLGKFAAKLWEGLSLLNDEDFEDCAISIMYILEISLPSSYGFLEGTGNRKRATPEELYGLIAKGVPVILKTLLTTEEGKVIIDKFAKKPISDILESNNGFGKLAGLIAVSLAIFAEATIRDGFIDLFDNMDEMSGTTGEKIIVNAVKNFTFNLLAMVPVVFLAIAAMDLILYAVVHLKEIDTFIKSEDKFNVILATVMSSWAEKLPNRAIDSIKIAIGKATEIYRGEKSKIIDFGDHLVSEAPDFFNNLSKNITGFFENRTKWTKELFGSASTALTFSGQIVTTITEIDEMQRSIRNLRQYYLEVKNAVSKTNTIVSNVYSHYNETNVLSCCQEIESNLRNAQKHVDTVERGLDRKCRVLVDFIDSYRKADQYSGYEIQKAMMGFA